LIFEFISFTYDSKLFVHVSIIHTYPFDNPSTINAVSRALKDSEIQDM